MKRSLLPEPVEQYVLGLISETPVQRRLRAETATLAQAGMQIGADQGVFLAVLARAIGARRALEIGTFTGYSALAVAAALPDDGVLVACDVSAEWTAIARRYWREAGVERKIDLRLGDARDTLAALQRDPGPGSFDLAFIDADKPGYDAYYEACLVLVRAGGLMLIDNILWDGRVADPANQEASTVVIRELSRKVMGDPRVEAVPLTVGDGVLLARKR